MAEVNINTKELDLVTTTMSNSSAAKAGCNSFGLVTTEEDDKGNPVPIMCTGLLTELPSFSISPTYDLSPGKTILDLYTDVFKKDEFDVAAVLMAASNTNYDVKAFKWQNLIQSGSMTRGMFKSVSYGDFSLKFKVYAQNTFGQSPIHEWKALLSKFAAPFVHASTSADTLLDNIEGALKILDKNGEVITKQLNQYRKGKIKEDVLSKTKRLIMWKMREVDLLLRKFCRILNEKFGTNDISIDFMGFSESDATPSITTITYVPIFKIVKPGNTPAELFINSDGKLEPKKGLKNLNISPKNILPWKKGKIVSTDRNSAYWFKLPNGGGLKKEYLEDFTQTEFYTKISGSGDNVVSIFEKLLIQTLVKDYYLKELYNGKTAEEQAAYKGREYSILRQEGYIKLKAIINKICNTLNALEPEDNSGSFITNLAKHTEHILDNVNVFINKSGFLNNYGKNRVYEELNRRTQLGEKLWHLYIYYPWLFSSPITICITDWSFTPSKQLQAVDGKPVYYEVEIKCKMDQIPSKQTWDDSFSEFCQIAAINN